MAFSNREFVRRNPVVMKRALRAILKADRVCVTAPGRAARSIVGRGFTSSYDYALQTMSDVPFGRWSEDNPADTMRMRFYALRLHEAKMITSSPQKILAQGTGWHVLNEVKKELKG